MARTTTDGGTTSGYSLIGSANIAIRPAMKMTIDSTAAKIGRSMKKRENCIGSALRGADVAGIGHHRWPASEPPSSGPDPHQAVHHDVLARLEAVS